MFGFGKSKLQKLKDSGVVPNCCGDYPNKDVVTDEVICHKKCSDDEVNQCIDFTYHS